MNRRGRSLNRFYPDDYGRTYEGWIPHSRPYTRGRSLHQLSPGDARRGFKMDDGHFRSSNLSPDFDEGGNRYRKSYQDYLRKDHTSNYDRRIGYVKTYDGSYKDHGQVGNEKEWSLRTDWNIGEKKASREGELLYKYEKWMSDKGWIRTYEGDWERSRIELNGFRWEKTEYYEKYEEWENEDWRETNRGRSRYRNSRSYNYMPGSKENWYKYREQDSFIEGQRFSSANHSRVNERKWYSKANKLISKFSGDTQYSLNERDRSPLNRDSRQMKRRISRENSSSRRAFSRDNNSATSGEGMESGSQLQEYHAVKSETNSTKKNRDTTSLESGEITESGPRSKPGRHSESPPRLKSQIGVIKTEKLRRRCSIQRPCDFYQRDACRFPSWHIDRSGCCRLHVCAFCFYQDYDLIKRGTPVLNLHMEKNCPRYIANVTLKRTKLRTKSLDRCHRSKEEQRFDDVSEYGSKKDQTNPPDNGLKKNRDNSSGVIKLRGKSLDRCFSKNRESNKPKLDFEMNNIQITVCNYSSKDENAKNSIDPREDYLEGNVQSKKVKTENTINHKEKIEESSDSETDGSESFSDTDDESKESTDDSRKSSEESDSTTSESHDSGREDRIKLLKAVIKDFKKLNDGSKTEDYFQNQKKERAKVLVSGLNPKVTLEDIRSLFSTVGRLEEAKLLGNSKAEVVFAKNGHALLAIEEFDNKCLDGKLINCSLKISTVYKEGQYQPEENHEEKGEECSSKISPLEETEKKAALNVDTIDLNISQDLFESAT